MIGSVRTPLPVAAKIAFATAAAIGGVAAFTMVHAIDTKDPRALCSGDMIEVAMTIGGHGLQASTTNNRVNRIVYAARAPTIPASGQSSSDC
jgi:hypothetical protein